MTPNVTVSVDGWSCDSGLLSPRVLTKLSGWYDGGDVRANPLDLLNGQDGVLDGSYSLGGRVFEIGGEVRAATPDGLRSEMDAVGRILKATRWGTLVVAENDRGISRQASVRLHSGTMVEQSRALTARFSLALFAADPLRYSSVLHQASTARYTEGGGRTYNLTFSRTYGPSGTAGFVTVTNAGDCPTWPVLRLTGPLVNPVVTLGGGGRVAPVLTLAAGQQLVIDMGARTVLLGEASRRSMLAWDSSWWPLPVGSSQVFFAADSGTGTLTVEWRDAWA